MSVLGLIWLALVVADLAGVALHWLTFLSNAIWAVFVFDFVVEVALAPTKRAYLRQNWLTLLSLLAPALRMLRILRMARLLRAVRVTRGLRLLKIVSSFNRALKALGAHMSRRGVPFVAASTLLVLLAGSAGIFAFESQVPGSKVGDFGAALWWTAMMLTTMGSEYWPQTSEGRALCFFLALHAFTVFGYVTAALASFFVGRDASGIDPAGNEELIRQLKALRDEVRALREGASTGASVNEDAG